MLHIDKLKKYSVILASQSPRRKEILLRIPGFEFVQITSPFDERTLDKNSFGSVQEYVTTSAKCKAQYLMDAKGKSGGDDRPPLVIAADTVVVREGQILEKPADAAKNLAFLRELNGSAHSVYTLHSALCSGSCCVLLPL